MFRRLYIVSILLLGVLSHLQAQELSSREQKRVSKLADEYLMIENYPAALDNFHKLLPYNPECANLMFKIGICYYETQRYPLALKSFEAAQRFNEETDRKCEAPLDLLYYQAKTLYFMDKAELAITLFEQLEAQLTPGSDHELLKQIKKDKDLCHKYVEFTQTKVDMTVVNLGDVINTEYAEHSPVISKDENTLIFTSRRKTEGVSLRDDRGEYYEDIYIATRENGEWTAPHSIGAGINTANHDASVALSADGTQLLIYRPEDNGSIFISTLSKGNWSVPEKLGPNINTSYRETSACFSPDGQTLYFTSDRPGGFGGLDIYISHRLPNGTWGKAVNLGKQINTSADEESPYLHHDGLTLYFSSKGHDSIGGYDIFSSSRTDSSWTQPHNLGFPVNSARDDVFFILSADGLRAYFASFKDDSYGDTDIYRIDFEQANKIEYVYVLGQVQMCDGVRIPRFQIFVTDNQTKEVVGIYAPNRRSGQFVLVLTPGHSYDLEFDYQGTVFNQDIIDLRDAHEAHLPYGPVELPFMPPCQKARAYKSSASGQLLTRIYFQGDNYELNRNQDLDKIANYLVQHPTAKINLTSLTVLDGVKADLYHQATLHMKSIKYYLQAHHVAAEQILTNVLGPAFSLESLTGSTKYDDRVEIHLLTPDSTFKLLWADPVSQGYEQK